MSDAKAAWVPLAREILLQTARTYHAYVTYGDLAEALQRQSGVRTRQLIHYWIGDVLGRVSADCHRRGEPMLSALCVRNDETIGDGYGVAVVERYGGIAPDNLEQHAAEERLRCYRFFGADLPPGGGVPALTPGAQAKRRAAKKKAQSEMATPICPTCNLALPKTGQCDFCQ